MAPDWMALDWHGPDQKSEGFTLVELLIAVTLLGLLMVMLFGGLRFGTRAMTAATTTVDRTADLASAYGFLREVLGNAQPLPIEGAGPQPPIRFEGDQHHMELVVLAPTNLGPGGFRIVEIGLEDPPAKPRLVLRWGGAPRGADAAPEIPPSVLLDRLAQVDFAYFGAIADGQAAAWHTSWQAAKSLPRLVRLRVILEDRRALPELLVAPRLADDSAVP
ncbi:MAG TPA: prepilin-type N-terminal cleavage/methylation domain-containing protein [Stellaceae bacterium]|jgi:general secretion pathway protein J|nr:prepilin-type N-terminal cleavage/methylation domain-containing protein [Stellaceae bacterium]